MENPNDRSGRIQAVKSEIQKAEEIKKEELIAQASLKLGVTQSKVKEYLDILKNVGDVNESDGTLMFQGDN